MQHVTHREAVSGTVIHRIFAMWHYEVRVDLTVN